MNVLLAVKPGPLRDGLDALLYATPEVQLVAHANDPGAALAFCQRHPTELIILEMRPGDRDQLAKIPEMKNLNPQGQVMVLIHNENGRDLAENSGADVVLISGMQAAKLKKMITEITASLSSEEMGSTEV